MRTKHYSHSERSQIEFFENNKKSIWHMAADQFLTECRESQFKWGLFTQSKITLSFSVELINKLVVGHFVKTTYGLFFLSKTPRPVVMKELPTLLLFLTTALF